MADGRVSIDRITLGSQSIAIAGWVWFGSPASEMRLVSARDPQMTYRFRNFRCASSDLVEQYGPEASHVRFDEVIEDWSGWDAYNIAFAVLLINLVDGRELRKPFTKLERDLVPPPALTSPPRLGIGITTYNRRQLLEQVLDGVATHTNQPYDLIVCDDGSEDDTVEMLRERGTPHIAAVNRGIAWNKNRALYYLAEVRRCDVVILLEDDTVPRESAWEHDWIAASLAYGQVNYAAPWFSERPVTGGKHWHDPAQSRPFSGQCVGFSRHALSIAGYMDPRFKGYGFEHIEHTIRLSRYGLGVGMADSRQAMSRLFYLIEGGVAVLDSKSHGTGDLVAANAPIFGEAMADFLYRGAWRTPEQREIMLAEMASATVG